MNERRRGVIVCLPERRTALRNINRQQNKTRPANPTSLPDLEVVHPYNETLGGELFLQRDVTDANGDRTLFFYTIDNLKYLCASPQVFCDGTFKVVPSIFYQLYTVHGIVFNNVFPLIYILTTKKDTVTYTTIFQTLQTHAQSLNLNLMPNIITADFELAAINSIQDVFPESDVKCCLFHWGQNIFRQAVNFGLKTIFRTNDDVKESILMLLALPFVPLDDLQDVFDKLETLIDERVLQLWDFIKINYVRGRARGRGRRAHAIEPRFPAARF